MTFIAHRINSRAQLREVPPEYGVEVDIRDQDGRLVLQHDPFMAGENFEELLGEYHHGTLILNIKSERTEFKVLELLSRYGIRDYFFLDSSFPMSYLLASKGERNIALRFSEFEGFDTILAMKDRITWVWVDCFTKLPITPESYAILKGAGLKLCLVSPELQGRPEDIEPYRDYLSRHRITFDAICTKIQNVERWAPSSGRH